MWHIELKRVSIHFGEMSRSGQIISHGHVNHAFTGWGRRKMVCLCANENSTFSVVYDTENKVTLREESNRKYTKHSARLSVLNSVSIAGCDLLGSCLYTAGVCAANGGKYAPLCLLLVTLMLFYFRLVYSEVVTALPVNGGTYNLLLNTTNKKAAAFVACLSLLSYTATTIVSAFDSMVYLAILWSSVDIRGFTVLVLAIFALITLCGIKESSTVTLFLFSIHTVTITILIIWGFAYGITDNFVTFNANMYSKLPNIVSSTGDSLAAHSVPASIFFGYASALLGITGFETASNYVEELKSPEVFIATVNWMWLLVGIYNPLLSVVSMMVLPMDEIFAHPSDMLAVMAGKMGGEIFKTFLCIDAIMILCGGVLTAMIGVTGLIERLAKDKVVPEGLAAISSWGVTYAAIISFTIFCIALFLCIYDPQNPVAINRFGGVFAISFLSVLAAFAFAALLLKVYRPKLARLVITKWWHVIFSFIAVLIGLIGNILLTPDVFVWFLVYLTGLLVIVGYMFLRVDILSVAIWMIRKFHFNRNYKEQSKQLDKQVIEAYQLQHDFNEFAFLSHIYHSSKITPSSLHHLDVTSQRARPLNHSANNEHEEIITVGGHTTTSIPLPTRAHSLSFNENTFRMKNPIRGRVLQRFTKALDQIVNEPVGYFMGRADPISLHLAMRYITANESSDMIYVIHFVDDRHLYSKPLELEEDQQQEEVEEMKEEEEEDVESNEGYCSRDATTILHRRRLLAQRILREIGLSTDIITELSLGIDDEDASKDQEKDAIKTEEKKEDDNNNDPVEDEDVDANCYYACLPEECKQIMDYVALLDTYYTFKKIHSVIVRGAYFCPTAIHAVTEYLNISLNSTIMGVPDTFFKFPFARISGCRLVVQEASPIVRRNALLHLTEVVQEMIRNTHSSS